LSNVEDSYLDKMVSGDFPLPDSGTETIVMEQWFRTTLEYLKGRYGLTEEKIVQFALAYPGGEDFVLNVKNTIWCFYHSYEKRFNPDEYDGTGFDEFDPDLIMIQEALDLLGLETPFTHEQLKKNYVSRIAKIHPDLMEEYNQAYEILKKELAKEKE